MTSKTSINANTTAYGFCRPGETVVVSNNNGSIVVPEGATMLRVLLFSIFISFQFFQTNSITNVSFRLKVVPSGWYKFVVVLMV